MFTTKDLPAAMRVDAVDVAILRAVRNSGLRLTATRCEHGRYDCAACVVEAARRLVEAAADQSPAA